MRRARREGDRGMGHGTEDREQGTGNREQGERMEGRVVEGRSDGGKG